MAITFTYDESTNIVVLTEGTSGTPATFANFVTADRAGTAELTPEDTPDACDFDMTLTYQIRPVEDLALQITFTLAGTSADTTQTWTAASYNITTGTYVAGNIASTYADDGNKLQIEEVTGSPALDFDFTWSGLPTNYFPEKVTLNGYYDGNVAHDKFIYMWNYDTTAWVRLTAAADDFPDAGADDDYSFDVPSVDTENYFDSGAAKVRINHTSGGSAGHDFYVDQILLTRPAPNNTLDITGTDWDGQAQQESIDVSAGDGAYNGAYKWRTITDMDCNGWADGTLKVTQPQWGVIWDYGKEKYQIDANFNIGNGSTATHFGMWDAEIVDFSQDLSFNSTANSTFYISKPDMSVTTNYRPGIIRTHGDSETTHVFVGKCLWYGLHWLGYKEGWEQTRITVSHADSVVRDTTFVNINHVIPNHATQTWTRVVSIRGVENIRNPLSVLTDGLVRHCYPSGSGAGIYITGGPVSVTGLTVANIAALGKDIFTNWNNNTHNFKNCSLDWSNLSMAGGYSAVFEEDYAVDVHVADKDGSNLQSVTVLCEDKNDTELFSVATAADGTIAQQTITVSTYDDEVETEKDPVKFTLSKAGYETLPLENITVDGPIDWHLELQDPSGGKKIILLIED